MPELVYPSVIAAAKTMFRVLDLKITVRAHTTCRGPAGRCMASNHVSYLDFIFCGFGAQGSKRLVRFMASSRCSRTRSPAR